jgi:iron complex transport system substrate-binding protein
MGVDKEERRSRKTLYAALTIVVVALLAVAVFVIYPQLLTPRKQPAGQEETYVTVQDMVGRTVKVPKEVRRIVAVDPSTLRLVVMLNATDRVVGITSYVDMGYANKLEDVVAHPELLNPSIARIGKPGEVDVEKIAEVKPDVVFLDATYSYLADQIEQKAKVPVVCTSTGGPGAYGGKPLDFYQGLRVVAKSLGKEAQAEKIIAYFEAKIQDVTRRIPKDQHPRVYLADWAYRYGVGWTTTLYWPLEVCGALNVAKEAEKRFNATYFEVSKEQIVLWDPEVIFIHGYKGRSSAEAILNDPALKSVKAVKDGRVYGLFGPYIFYDPKTLIVDMYHIGRTLYPEGFKDVDVLKVGEEVFKFFYGEVGPSVFNKILVNRGIYLSPDLDFSKK